MLKDPVAHSTPIEAHFKVKRRPGIKDFKKENEYISDVEHSGYESDGTKEQYCRLQNDSLEVKESILENTKNNDYKISTYQICSVSFVVLLVGILMYYPKLYSEEIHTKIKISKLKQEYGAQEEDFWLSFQVLINETIHQNRPKSLVLLYTDENLSTVETLLSDLSSYAVCEISECSYIPVILSGDDMAKHNFDYGSIITQNKDNLEKTGVMVVRNIDKFTGKMALAFHSLCDEFQPVVQKAFFLFSLRIQKHPSDKLQYVENILREKWSDLNDDLFHPLFTRIFNMIFMIKLPR